MVKVGLCGFTMAMTEYARHFPVVEVQQTFYDPPSDAIMQRWVTRARPGLEFTMKAWQLITHESKSPTYRRLRRPLDATQRATCGAFRDSDIVRAAFARTLVAARVIGATAILFQCPASFRPETENVARLRAFFAGIANPERPVGVRYLWEPRGAEWSRNAVLAHDLARELDLVHVIDPFVDEPQHSAPGAAYFRLHGISGARHVYTDDELRRLVAMTPGDAYVMFNNIPRVRDAKRFAELLRADRVTAVVSPPGT
ncbi:MAG TPA: DUF72 domain-containing protein [Polyangiaceae bacterium]|nr:DUF72 domain-containing protein [Polyangiaceae bacterium]